MTHVLFIVHAPPLRDKDCKKILDAFKSAFVSYLDKQQYNKLGF